MIDPALGELRHGEVRSIVPTASLSSDWLGSLDIRRLSPTLRTFVARSLLSSQAEGGVAQIVPRK